MTEVADTAVVYPGTVLGDGCVIGDHAVVGKQPALSPRSTATRDELPPLELGAGTIVSAGAIVFAGTRIGARVIVGDQACVRERCEVADDVVIGRGSLVENDTTIGALTKIQANAYVTAYSTLEEEVFIAPGVLTTNDNFMPTPWPQPRPLITKTGEPGSAFGADGFAPPEEAPARTTVATSAARSVERAIVAVVFGFRGRCPERRPQARMRLSHRSEYGTPLYRNFRKAQQSEGFHPSGFGYEWSRHLMSSEHRLLPPRYLQPTRVGYGGMRVTRKTS